MLTKRQNSRIIKHVPLRERKNLREIESKEGTQKEQRFVDKNKKRVWLFLEDRMKSDKEYEIRFGVVMAMAHYIDEEYINNVLQWMDRISHEGYYVKMAVAWALSVCYVKFPQKTVNYLKENHLDDFTYNKALQKIIESYRVSTEDKEIIRSMKRKNK